MKILMVTDSMARGGKERRMLELIKGLSQKPDYSIMLVSLTDNLEYEYVHQLPIEFKVIKRNHRRDFSVIGKLDKIVQKFAPDIVHSWGSMASVFLLPVVWIRRKMFLNGIIADAPGKLRWYHSTYLRKMITYPFSNIIISNSMAGIESYRAPTKKSVCIYNGVDLKRFSHLPDADSVRKEIFPDWKEGIYVVGMVAAFEERKDYKTLIKVAITLVTQDDNIRFVLVGDGIDFPAIWNSVPETLKSRIRFLGKRADVEAIVQILDVGILLTNSNVHGEGISNSIIEYMALGKPVIATRGGGTCEIVKDGDNGYLIDPGSTEQLSNRIRELKNDRIKAEKMGKAGSELIRQQFNLDTMTEKYKNIYQRLLNERTKA